LEQTELQAKVLKHSDDIKELKHKTNGIGNTVDSIKAVQSSMNKEFGFIKGLATSADRGYHSLSARVADISAAQDSFRDDLKDVKRYVEKIQGTIWKSTLTTVISVLTILSLSVGIFYYINTAINDNNKKQETIEKAAK